VVLFFNIAHLTIVINNRDETVLKQFGEHLRHIRISKKLSQQKLELLAGISKNQVGNIERGEVNITLITAIALAKALDIALKDFYDF
jgi:transcriptional regulator with XRE-family HTH domain